MTQRATTGRYVAPICRRRRSTPDMSASTIVVQCAAVCSEASMCRPIDRRMRESSPGAAGLASGTGSGRYGDSMCIGGSAFSTAPPPPFSRYASTSFLVTRPPRPVPSICERSRSCSAAMRATTGEMRRSPLPLPACEGAGVGDVGAGVSPVAAAASLVSGGGGGSLSLACASPGLASVASRASTVPTSTVVPTSTRISVRRPAAGDGQSVSILSVEISQIVSSYSTQSPTCFFHSTIVPSETETPIWGIVTSIVSVAEELTGGLLHAVDAGQDGLLQRWGERDRDVGRRDARDRPVEVLERALGDQRRDLGAGGAGPVGLVEDQHLRRLAHR